jgi:hypothetical protein
MRWVGIGRGEVHDYKYLLPRHASLPRNAQAFAPAPPEKILGSSCMPLGLENREKSATANHENRFAK